MPKRCAVSLSRSIALDRAIELKPQLRARSEQCEAERRAPIATVDDLRDSGLLRLMQPRVFGGAEQPWDVFCEVTQILAAGCGSQAWVYRVLADHAQMIGLFPGEGQQEVWGNDPNALASSSFEPVGRATATAGGFYLTGKYSFSSGIDYADWVILGGKAEDPDLAAPGKKSLYFLVRRDEGEVIDDWYVNGLEGSGSKSFVLREVFVPTRRVLGWDEAALGDGPGGKLHDGAVFRLPRGGYTTSGFAALLVGMAKGLLQDWVEYVRTRRFEGAAYAEMESTQISAAQAQSEIRAAEHYYLQVIRRAMRAVEGGGRLPPERALEARAAVSFSCQLVVSAANRIHACLGSRAVYRGNSMERQYRNIMVGVQHIGVNWPRAAAAHGAQLLRDGTDA